MYMKFKTIWIESKKQPGKESTRKGLTPFTLIAVCQQGRLAIDNYQNNFGLFILEKKKKKKRKQNRIIYCQIFEHENRHSNSRSLSKQRGKKRFQVRFLFIPEKRFPYF